MQDEPTTSASGNAAAIETTRDSFVITVDDLRRVERAIILRLGAGEERQRAARMRALVGVTTELTRTLTTYSRHALVHCQGTAGASDLSDDTRRLVEALESFCDEIRVVAGEYSEHFSEAAR